MTPPPCGEQDVRQQAEEQRESAGRDAMPCGLRGKIRLLPRPPGINGIRDQRPDHGLCRLFSRRGRLVIVHVGIPESRRIGQDPKPKINHLLFRRLEIRCRLHHALAVLQVHEVDRLYLHLQNRLALGLCRHFPFPLAVGEP